MITKGGWRIGNCKPTLITELRRMLVASGLPDNDVGPDMAGDFLVATDDAGRVCGAIAMEQYGEDGLLRSLVVDPELRRMSLGKHLVDALEQEAVSRGVRTFYLLTNTAESYFPRLGYLPTERSSVPESIRNTSQFRELCPASAACFRKLLDDQETGLGSGEG